MSAEKRLAAMLEERGFRVVKGVSNVLDVTEYAAALELLKEVSKIDVPQKFYLTRQVHFKNEWHDEHLTQVQAFIVQDKVGLGTVRKLAEDMIGVYYDGQDVRVTIKSEYIHDIVPAIEILANDKNVIGGGFVRDDVMACAGLNGFHCVVVTFIAERF